MRSSADTDDRALRPAFVGALAITVLLAAIVALLARVQPTVRLGATVLPSSSGDPFTVARSLDDALGQTPVRLTAGDVEHLTTVAALGISLDADAIASEVDRASAGLTSRITAAFGRDVQLDVTLRSADSLSRALAAQALGTHPTQARLDLRTPVRLIPSADGQRVDRAQLMAAVLPAVRARVSAGDLGDASPLIEVRIAAPTLVMPRVRTADLEALAARASLVADDDVVIEVGTRDVRITGGDVLALHDVVLEIDRDTVQASLRLVESRIPDNIRTELAADDVAAVDAQILVDQVALSGPSRSDQEDPERFTGDVRVEGGTPGRTIDVPATFARAVAEAGAGEDRVDAVTTIDTPKLDLAAAAAAGVMQPISSFTTFHSAGQSRVTNIQTMARFVDGATILPGESFELNHYVGRRTRAKGYVGGGAISNGEFIESIGGGVSQFATTFFNAAWFSGILIDEYKAHSFYISRYPAGREATVDFPSVNLGVTNDTPHAIVVKTSFTPTSITVTFWSTPYFGVETITGRRRTTSAGFNINVTRVRTPPNGERDARTFTTVYKVQ